MLNNNIKELCKVGDKLYCVSKNEVLEVTVIAIKHYPHSVYRVQRNGYYNSYFNENFGKNVFKTYEEADIAKEHKLLITKKRELLKEYETELNEKLGLKDHIIIR